MRSGVLYAAVCLTFAAFTQAADAKTVTEYKTVTTTEYRDHETTTGAGGEHTMTSDAPAESSGYDNGGPYEPSSYPASPYEAPKDESSTAEPAPSSDVSAIASPEPPKDTGIPGAPPPPKSSDAPALAPPGANKGTTTGMPGAPTTGPAGPAITTHPGGKGKGSSAVGGKSSSNGFSFSPITLAPESSKSHRATSLREMTASRPTASAGGAHNGGAALSSVPFASVAGFTILGVAAALIQM